jgi:hypothetical protein
MQYGILVKGSQKHAIGSDIITWGKAVLIFISHVFTRVSSGMWWSVCMWVSAGLPVPTVQQPSAHTHKVSEQRKVL